MEIDLYCKALQSTAKYLQVYVFLFMQTRGRVNEKNYGMKYFQKKEKENAVG